MKKPSPEQVLIQQHNCTWSVAHHALMRAKVELGHHYTVRLKSLSSCVRKSIVKAASALIDDDVAANNTNHNIVTDLQVPLGLRAVPPNRRPIGLEFHSLHDPAPMIAGANNRKYHKVSSSSGGGRAFLKT